MSELKIGDILNTGKYIFYLFNNELDFYTIFHYYFIAFNQINSGDNDRYNKVTAFIRKKSINTSSYKSILTSCNKTIRLTGSYLIYSRKEHYQTFIQM